MKLACNRSSATGSNVRNSDFEECRRGEDLELAIDLTKHREIKSLIKIAFLNLCTSMSISNPKVIVILVTGKKYRRR